MVLYEIHKHVVLRRQNMWVKKKKQFVQNQPTKFSYLHDGLKTVRNLQTMRYGFVTLIYVDKHPKQ